MSREIKFRAWFKPTHEYKCEFMDRYGHELEDIECRYYTEEDFLDDSWCCTSDYESIVFEQYTGLKDKNGKEIYEGDIVKARWRRAKHAKLDTQGEVKFGNGWFYIDDDPDGQDRLGIPIHNCYNVEVIGNIHENPELLEGDK